jgi:hypothetical protein
MLIANQYRDESREQASSDATRVAMNYCTFDHDEDRNAQTTSSNARSKRSATSEARGLARSDRGDRLGLQEHTNLWPKKSKKGINNQLDCDCCRVPRP